MLFLLLENPCSTAGLGETASGLDFLRWLLVAPAAWLLSRFEAFTRHSVLVMLLLGLAAWQLHEINREAPRSPPSSGKGYVLDVNRRTNGFALRLDIPAGEVRVSLRGNRTPLPGDSITWSTNWKAVEPVSLPGSFDSQRWLRNEGLQASGALTTWQTYASHPTPMRYAFYAREALRIRMEQRFSPTITALLMGLLAGDRSGLSADLQGDFQRTGLVHVLAISGFHVVLLAGILTLFLRALRLPHSVVRWLSMGLLCLYAPVAGGSAAVWRAVLMFLVLESATLRGIRADPLNSLGVAMLLLLFLHPTQAGSAGFQLSVAATAGILAAGKAPWKSFRSAPLRLLDSFVLSPSWTTLCASLATLPLLVYHFQAVSPISWLGNLIVVPLMGLGMESALLALAAPMIGGIAPNFAASSSLLLSVASHLVSWLADFPGASLTLGPWPWFLLLSASCGVASAAIALKGYRTARKWVFISILIFVIHYVGTGLYSLYNPRWNLVVADVGQGDAILVQSPDQRNFLVDTGPPMRGKDAARDRLIPFLRVQGVGSLHALVITHPDADHFGAATALIRQFPVRELWIPHCARWAEKPAWDTTMAIAAKQGLTIRDLERGMGFREKNWKIQVLHPGDDCPADVNSYSLVIRMEGPGGAALLTGDADSAAERELLALPLRSDILKSGHHGSKTSGSREFLHMANPALALISVGKKNRYGHPHRQTFSRLRSIGIPWQTTAESGSLGIVFESHGWQSFHFQDGWQPLLNRK